MKRCCVIGGAGFIGHFIVRSLLEEGRKVIVVGRSAVPSRLLPESVEYISGDYGDSYLLESILRGVDEVIDLAYASVPKTSFDNPVKDIFDNLPSTVKLLEVASRIPHVKVVLTSSGGAVYGTTESALIHEGHPTNPIAPYGITKLAIEKYAQMFHATKGLSVVCVRPGNAYGELQLPFVGQGFVATAIASIMNGTELSLYGESGTIRDYIHVSDVASGILAVLNRGVDGQVYNIGSGIGKSNYDVLDVLKPYALHAGYQVRLKIHAKREFDVPINVLDCTKLRSLSGWSPKISFKEGMENTWNWFLENPIICHGVVR